MNSLDRLRRRQTTNSHGNGRSQPNTSSKSSTSPDVDANISASDYARRCKELMELSKALRAVGAETYIDLPCITVIGGQSAGKSSLVEAISGINLPRDAGTTTRCPMECSMSSAATTWSCTITLRFVFDDTGSRLDTPRMVAFGPPLITKDSVDLAIRRAQAAILNPHISSETFLTKTLDELRKSSPESTLKFSKNIVCVDVNDPEATDLSFIDLPGLIQNESPDAIQVVRDLTVFHIRSEKTIILIAIPMTDDIQNQQAVTLAREADPEGKRTIGVLTKPDMLNEGATSARQEWSNILQDRNPNHRLYHGYYCVRLPNDAERSRNITRVDSQRNAAEFFDNTSPWKDIPDRRRFGIPGFVADISKLLMNLINDSLPKLKEDVNALLAQSQEELLGLPAKMTHEAAVEVLLLINAFKGDIENAVYARDYKSFVQKNRTRFSLFKTDIESTAPDFRPFRDHKLYVKPTYAELDNGSSQLSSVPPMDLSDVRSVIEQSTGWELLDHVPFDATKELISRTVKRWRNPSISCFGDVYANLSAMLDHFVGIHFGRYKGLEDRVRMVIQTELANSKADTLKNLEDFLELESVPYYTQNVSTWSGTKIWLNRYRNAYLHPQNYDISRQSNLYSYPVADAMDYAFLTQALNSAGFRDVAVQDLARLSVPNPVLEELTLMAKVMAFYEVAYNRLCDYLPLLVEHKLNQAVAKKLLPSLLETFFSSTSEPLKDLLVEDPAIARKRELLEGKVKQLMEIKSKLDGFGTTTLLLPKQDPTNNTHEEAD